MSLLDKLVRNDNFLKWMGVEVLGAAPGWAKVKGVPSPSHCNFNGVVHGGYIFSLADIAFSYASNLHGKEALALDMYISFRKAIKPGTALVAEAKEIDRRGRTAIYLITVNEEGGDLVASLQCTVYVREREPGEGCG